MASIKLPRPLPLLKVFSRFGMMEFPIGKDKLNLGIETGPSFMDPILAVDQTSGANNFQVESYTFPEPPPPLGEDREDEDQQSKLITYYNRMAEHAEAATEQLIQMSSKPGHAVIGGDHSVAFASLLATLKKAQDRSTVGIIMFDSHADLHLTETSPTGNFHGMWLRPFFGDFDNDAINSLVADYLIQPEQLFFVGQLQAEAEEKRFIAAHGIENLDRATVDEEGSDERLVNFVQRFDHLHISFDIDVFEEKIAPATGTPGNPGLGKKSVMDKLQLALETVAQNNASLSFEIVEVNPVLPGGEQTTALAREVFSTFFKA